MPDASDARAPGPSVERTAGERAADHAAIGRLTGELLPALIAKLAATDLGEIEVREGGWKVRLRRPATAAAGSPRSRRAIERGPRAQPGHEAHGHAPGAVEGARGRQPDGYSTNGSGPAPARPATDPASAAGDERDQPARRADPHRAVATSPAVGIFRPGPELRPGARVRGGDRLGVVDVLGVPQEVAAPADGVVAAVLTEAGDAVEYGQELVALELTTYAGAVVEGLE